MKFPYIQSPLNYIGGKYKLLPQLLPLFPRQIGTFVDLFCGGCNVGVNVRAERTIFNDNIPYLITTGTYNDGRRGFTGWNEAQERTLLNILDELHARGVSFALSNVLEHRGKMNTILAEWITRRGYAVNYLNKNYNNSNYQITHREGRSVEVLVVNYRPDAHEAILFV